MEVLAVALGQLTGLQTLNLVLPLSRCPSLDPHPPTPGLASVSAELSLVLAARCETLPQSNR
jgi:hypothetical protein